MYKICCLSKKEMKMYINIYSHKYVYTYTHNTYILIFSKIEEITVKFKDLLTENRKMVGIGPRPLRKRNCLDLT